MNLGTLGNIIANISLTLLFAFVAIYTLSENTPNTPEFYLGLIFAFLCWIGSFLVEIKQYLQEAKKG